MSLTHSTLIPFPESVPNCPLVSVILPVYQGEKTVLSAVHSVLNQTYTNLELIIINDGSTDGTLEQLMSIKSSRVSLIDQKNQGVSASRDNAFSKAKGEYIAFIDADDLWFPEKIETEMTTLKTYQDPVSLIYSWYYAVDEDGRLTNLSPTYRNKGNILDAIIHQESMMLPSTILMHRKIYETIGGFKAIPKDCELEDRPFFIKACKYFPAYPTEQRLVIYQQLMSGRCRSILKDYDRACYSEFRVLDAVRNDLSPTEIKELEKFHTKSLFYRFLMYGFTNEAKSLYKNLKENELIQEKKGILALASMKSGINILYAIRLVVQTFIKYLSYPWWHWRRSEIYQAV